MIEIFVRNEKGFTSVMTTTGSESLWSCKNFFNSKGLLLDSSSVYLTVNGKLVNDDTPLQHKATYCIVPRLCGGKGGFGSMLRSIGAQIEKTTSREACRDLSGRRMRDINNEKKLKDWLAKKSEREKDRAEKRRNSLEQKLKKKTHVFDDRVYHEQKAHVSENLEDALAIGLAQASSGGSLGKRTHSKAIGASSSTAGPSSSKQFCTWMDIDSNISDSDSDSGSESVHCSLEPTTTETKCDDKSSTALCQPTSSSDNVECHSSNKAIVDVANEPSSQNDSNVPPVTNSEDIVTSSHDDSVSTTNTKEADTNPPLPDSHCEPMGASDTQKIVDLASYKSAEEISILGLDTLKFELIKRGLKCGGSLQERADRLFSIKDLSLDQIPSSLKADKNNRKSRNKKNKAVLPN